MKVSRIIAALSMLLFLAGCGEKEPKEPQQQYELTKFITSCSFPGEVKAERGASYRIAGQGFEDGDILRFEADGQKPVDVELFGIGYSEARFTIVDGLQSQIMYVVSVIRGNKLQKLGKTVFVLVDHVLRYNVSGKVTAEGSGVRGVYVTDGFAWTRTDADGHYELMSDKAYGVVYIVTPSGYECRAIQPAFPGYWQSLSSTQVTTQEEHDFELIPVNQSRYTFIMSADWQFRNALRPKDVDQAIAFKNEVNAYVRSSQTPVYSMAMGDQTWDLFWYNNNFAPAQFRDYVSDLACSFFPVIGNHDYDYKAVCDESSDLIGSAPYRRSFGPTYYSMDIGSFHFISVDDVTFVSEGNGTRSTIEAIDSDQLRWLEEDLSHVSMDTPIVVGAHVPMHFWRWNGSSWYATERGSNLSEFLAMLKKFSNVYIYSGHSHYSEYFDVTYEKLADRNMIERKIPALGGTIWVSGALSGYNIAIDGCPAGYDIVEIDGTTLKSRYKVVGCDDDYRMRAYDMNSVRKYWAEDADIKALAEFNTSYAYSALYGALPENAVLLNVFEADPHQRTMKVEVRENGRKLELKPAIVKDPLHVLATEAPYLKTNKQMAGDSYLANTSAHMFYVVPSSSQTRLEVTLTDRYDDPQTVTVELPKPFINENIQ